MPRRLDLNPFQFPSRASSWNPLMSLSPGGPDNRATSFHFSYRLRTSTGTFAFSSRSSWRCSWMSHMFYCTYTLFGMSINFGLHNADIYRQRAQAAICATLTACKNWRVGALSGATFSYVFTRRSLQWTTNYVFQYIWQVADVLLAAVTSSFDRAD